MAPALHAKDTSEGLSGDVAAECWFLHNRDNPLALPAIIGQDRRSSCASITPLEARGLDAGRSALESGRGHRSTQVCTSSSAASHHTPAGMTEAIARLARMSSIAVPAWLRFSGHTGQHRRRRRRLKLSRARATAVRDAIVAARSGKIADRLDADGSGATRPRESNDTPEGRARNRRVEALRISSGRSRGSFIRGSIV